MKVTLVKMYETPKPFGNNSIIPRRSENDEEDISVRSVPAILKDDTKRNEYKAIQCFMTWVSYNK